MNEKLAIVPNSDSPPEVGTLELNNSEGTWDVVTVREFRDSPPEVWTVHYSNLSWTGAQDALEHLSNYAFYKGL